jgi:PAS domain S-box-containing protein
LDLINDYATEGYFFWKKNSPDRVLIDSKLSSRFSQEQQSIEIDLITSNDDFSLFIQSIIEGVSQFKDTKKQSTFIAERFIGDNLYNTKVYFSCHEQPDSGNLSLFYLVAIKSSEFLHKRNPLDSISSGINLANWQFNAQTGELHVNDYWISSLGYSREELRPINFGTFADLTHPEDLISVKEVLEGYIIGERPEYRSEIRLKHKNGNWIWFLTKGETISKSPDGRVEWMVGSHIDISRRKEEEKESEILASVAKQTDYAIVMTDAKGITTFINDAFINYTGYSREEFIGHKPGSILQGKLTSKQDVESFRKNLSKNKTFSQEILNYKKNGEAYDNSCFVTPVFDKNGEVEKYISLQRDVTVDNKNKDFLRTFKNTLDQTKDCIFLFNKSTLQFFYVNQGAIDMMGYERNELLNLHPYDIKPEYPEEKFRALIDDLISSDEKSIRFETRHQHKNGDEFPVEVFLQYIDEKTDESYFLATVHDISERLENERQLKQLSLVAEHTTDFVIVMDHSGNIEFVNEAFEIKTGYSINEVKGKRLESFLHGAESQSDDFEINRKGFQSLRPFKQEVLNYSRAGDKYWVSTTYNPIFNKDGEVENIIAIGKDTTERKELEFSLQKEKNFQDQIINSKILSIVIINSEGEITFANKGAEKILGLTKSQIETTKYNDPVWNHITLEGDPFPQEELPFMQVMTSKQEVTDVRYGLVDTEGNVNYISVSGAPFEYAGDQISNIIFSIIDITERVKTQRQLDKTENQMQSILKETSDVVYSISIPENKLTYITPSVEKITGYPQSFYYRDEFTEDKWIESVHKEDRHVYKKGLEDLKRHGQFEVEFRVRNKENQYRWVLSKGNLILKNNIAFRFDGYVTDITNRKKDENEIKEYITIVEAQNERLKNFAYIVSHNLRSHSANIYGLLDIMEIKHPELKNNQYIQYLNTASVNLENTLHSLNDVVSVVSSKHETEIVTLKPYIENFRSTFKTMLDEASVKFINEINDKIELKVVPAFLESIITNLITNAIRYRDPNKDSFVRLSIQKNKKYNIFKVEDNGLGIDLKLYRDKVFGMYKTFHKNKDAKGIGLFLTKNQIESMGGKITVDSEVGKGSTFKVYFKHERL